MLTTVEVQRTAAMHQQTQARSNALLGLHIALGEMQRQLGPDQRITAPASLLDTVADGKEQWIGVWNSDGSGTPGWLVSGQESIEEPMSSSSVPLLAAGSSGMEIHVPLVEFSDSAGRPGAYAYWVDDLSQKARADLEGPLPLDTESISWLQAPPAYGLSILPGLEELAIETGEGTTLRDKLLLLAKVSDLALLSSDLGEASQAYLNALSVGSYGLHTNVVEGGLKTDLSAALAPGSSTPSGDIYPDGPPWGLLRDFVSLGGKVSDAGITPEPRNPTTPGGGLEGPYPTQHGVVPLVMFWELGFEITPEPLPDYGPDDLVPLHLRVEPVVVMLNPYDVALEAQRYVLRLSSGATTYVPEGSGRVNRSPAFHLTVLGDNARTLTPSEGGYLNQWLPDFQGVDAPGNTNNAFQRNGLRVAFTAAFAPGEMKVFSLAQNTDLPGQSDDYLLVLEEGEPWGFYAESADISPRLADHYTGDDYDQSGGGNSLQLRTVAGTVVVNLFVDSVDREPHQSAQSANLTSTQRVRHLVPSTAGARTHIGAILKGPNDRLNSERNPESLEGAQTIAHYDIRSHYQSTAFKSTEPETDFKSTPTYVPRSDDQSFYNGLVSSWGWPRAVLFHVPRTPIVSLGTLQHASLGRNVFTPTYAIGNSLANPWVPGNALTGSRTHLEDISFKLNEALWDAYFFSSIPADDSQVAIPTNPRMKVLAEAESTPGEEQLRDAHEVARWLLVEGPFNVNSASVEAWSTLLAGLRGYPLAYREAMTGQWASEGAEGGAFARIPIPSGASVPGGIGEGAGADESAPLYWRGFILARVNNCEIYLSQLTLFVMIIP